MHMERPGGRSEPEALGGGTPLGGSQRSLTRGVGTVRKEEKQGQRDGEGSAP